VLGHLYGRWFVQVSEYFDYQNLEIVEFILAESLTFIALLPIAKVANMEK